MHNIICHLYREEFKTPPPLPLYLSPPLFSSFPPNPSSPPTLPHPSSHLHLIATGHTIIFTGSAGIPVYEQALSSVTYFNMAPEPSHAPPRRITIEVNDGIFTSNTLTGLVNITLVNDNLLMLVCGVGVANFTEGRGSPVLLAQSLSLVDLDANHMILAARVAIQNTQEGDTIGVNTTGVGGLEVQPNAGSITISGEATSAEYQVFVYVYGVRIIECVYYAGIATSNGICVGMYVCISFGLVWTLLLT